jgi:hypothetical protein
MLSTVFQVSKAVLDIFGVVSLASSFLENDEDEIYEEGEDEIDEEEADKIIGEQIDLAKSFISVCSHCCDIDSSSETEKDLLADEFITALVENRSLFPESIIVGDLYFELEHDVIYEELVNTFNYPLPLKTIIKLATDDDALAASFYDLACSIMANKGFITALDLGKFQDLVFEWIVSEVSYSIDNYVKLLSTFSPYIALDELTRKSLFTALKKVIQDNFGERIPLSYMCAFHVARKLNLDR